MTVDQAYDLFQEELQFEASELAGYLECGIVFSVFKYAYNEGYADCRERVEREKR